MNRLQRAALFLLAGIALALALTRPGSALLQSQRAQIGVTIVVNVTPSPIAYAPRVIAQQVTAAPPIMARLAMRARGSQDAVDSTASLDLRNMVAVQQKQSALRVQATVTPNPTGTLLVSNLPTATMSGTAGTTVKASCVYTVSVNTSITSWTLDDGLSANFATGFSGTNLANDTYLNGATPKPTSTPFVVYPSAWAAVVSNGLSKTYCVDLTIAIPGSVAGGTYSTNAVYTLYY
jgi:hypothetical protein